MKLYIAGPMRGIPHYNFEAFDDAERALSWQGPRTYEVVSPAQYDREHGFDPIRDDLTGDEELSTLGFDLKAALAHDLDVVCTEVDAVAVLDGWEHSSGARAEVATALALGKPVRPVRCWQLDLADACQAHEVTELPQRALAAETQWHYDPSGCLPTSGAAAHAEPRVDAMPDSAHERLRREREHGIPAGHVHFATEHPVKGCKACLDDVARAALDGDFDKIDWTSPPGRLGAPVRDGQPERVRAHSDTLHNHLARLSYPIPAADMRPVGECAACDAQREAFPPDGQPHDDVASSARSTLRRGEELRVTSSTGGAKGMKLAQLGAIDPQSLLTLAEVAGFGAQKYDRYNYLRGVDWSLFLDALLRHVLSFWNGEDDDPESGLPHIAHAAWQCLALLSMQQRELGTDDRFKGEV